jgi:hypothetical protein
MQSFIASMKTVGSEQRGIFMKVDRATLVESVIEAFKELNAGKLFIPITVSMKGEEGVDAGGLTREMLQTFLSELCKDNQYFTNSGRFYYHYCCCSLLVVICLLLVVCCLLLVVCCMLLVDCCLLLVGCCLLLVGHLLLIVGRLMLDVGRLMLDVGCLLFVDRLILLLVVCCWLFVVGC